MFFLSVHASVKKWGDTAKNAIREALKGLIKEMVFEEVPEITIDQKRKTLMIHCFVVEKHD
jgi:histone H3/H4